MFELIDAIEQAIRNDNKASALASLNTLRERLKAEGFHQEPPKGIWKAWYLRETLGESTTELHPGIIKSEKEDETIQLGTPSPKKTKKKKFMRRDDK